MPLLMPTYHLGTLGNPQRAGYLGGSPLNLNHRDRARGDPSLDPVWLVPGGLAVLSGDGDVAPWSPRVARQRGDVRVDLRYHEGALARPGLDQSEDGEPLDRVPHGVPRRVVVLLELPLRLQLLPWLECSGLNLFS